MKTKKIVSLLGIFYFLFIQGIAACTGIIITTEDGVTIPGRTMEFGFDVQSKVMVIPKGIPLTFLSSIDNKDGYKMTTKYGFTGMNAVGKNVIADGVNEAGLYLGVFYFTNFAVYEKLTADNQSKAVSSEELGNYILGSFANVEEVIEGLKNITVVGSYIEAIKGEAPLHYAVTDKSGRSVVIEYTKDGLHVFENTVHAVCNNPTYDWHLTNLRNYVNLAPDNTTGFELNGKKYTPMAEGSGMIGLPGDYTSTSRFIRATAAVNTSLPSKDAEEGIFRAFHILNAFDIPKGLVRQKEETGVFTDYTIWTSAVDTENLAYYYKTYKNQAIKKIDLKQMLKEANGKITVIPSETPRSYEMVSTK